MSSPSNAAFCLIGLASLLLLASLSLAAPLNVHLVPHSHDDLGWKKTVDEYYTGENDTLLGPGFHASVHSILDTVVKCLAENSNRTFIVVEQGFFSVWWKQQTQSTQTLVRKLIANKQLLFINGGWCMHDEATTHYIDMIDQMTLGHRFLLDELQTYPEVSWQIDTFGHSITQAWLTGEIGFDSMYVARVDYQDFQNRQDKKTLDLIWQSTTGAPIFTTILYFHYEPPPTFFYESGRDNEGPEWDDDPQSKGYNVPERVNTFVNYVLNQQSKAYPTNNVLIAMGTDFSYNNATQWFTNIEKLIEHVNADGRLNVFYSTPQNYSKAVQSSLDTPLDVKTDDFFPYANYADEFWTGFFTSRPTFKRFIRESSNILQAARQLEAFAARSNPSATTLSLERANAVCTHHDASPGTAEQHVTNDYSKQLSIGLAESREVMFSALAERLSNDSTASTLHFQYCEYLNASHCPASQSGTGQAIVLYNSLAQPRQHHIRLPIADADKDRCQIFDDAGKEVLSQVVPNSLGDLSLPNGLVSSNLQIVFTAELPPLGYKTYFLVFNGTRASMTHTTSKRDAVMENKCLKLTYNDVTGELISAVNKCDGTQIALKQELLWYPSVGSPNEQSSGPYVFRATSSQARGFGGKPSVHHVVQGAKVQEIHQTVADWAHQVTRIYDDADYIEFEFTVGAIPIADGQGKEVISRFTTDVKSGSDFYTDANGREMQKRTLNYRPSWSFYQTDDLAGNYFPVTAAIAIKDINNETQVTVVNDRSQGGSSLRSGEIELMLHRRCLYDDWKGLGEPLNETACGCVNCGCRGLSARGTHRLHFGKVETATSQWRNSAQDIYGSPIIAFSALSGSVSDWLHDHRSASASFISKALPGNVQLITLQLLRDGSHLIRLAHLFAAGEDTTLSASITFDLADVLPSSWAVKSVEERNLSANKAHSMQYVSANATAVTLNPMQVRTFIVHTLRI